MKCKVMIDYLTFSLKNWEPSDVIRGVLGMDPALFEDPGFGLLGYGQALKFSDIFVLYQPRENEYFQDMGVCVSMSGNGCRVFESMSSFGRDGSAFPALFERLVADETFNVSRLDIACDDHEGVLDMDAVVDKVQKNELNTRSSKRSVVVSYDGTQKNGVTAYIGAASSDFRIRIYDKGLEQGIEEHWLRVEMVMRGSHAKSFVLNLTGGQAIGQLAAQVLNDKLSFIERDDSNISRCSVCDWWAAFVDELEAVRLVSREAAQHAVEHIQEWIASQVGPSLAVLFETVGWSRIFELAVSSQKRLSDRQRALIKDFNSLSPALG